MGQRPNVAQVTLRLTDAEFAAVRAGFKALGYDPGSDDRFVALMAVVEFQRAHALTADGILGRATTLTTLQRSLNARAALVAPIATGAAGGSQVIGNPVSDALAVPDWTGWLVIGGVAIWFLWLAWSYRDVVAGS